ncbi:MAG: hypothetical protein QFE16_16630 [Pseudomonadota bacterium]|nr:hypothetical protein [Pseudomonadota bacterium]
MATQTAACIVLHGQGRRNVVFWIGVRLYLFDPDRIFSDQGIEDTLRFHGAYSQAAHMAMTCLCKASSINCNPSARRWWWRCTTTASATARSTVT